MTGSLSSQLMEALSSTGDSTSPSPSWSTASSERPARSPSTSDSGRCEPLGVREAFWRFFATLPVASSSRPVRAK